MDMKKFDFDEIINRKHTDCVKWDAVPDEGIIPMWVADMDFKTAPCIIEALRRRVDQGVFGYTHVPEAYYDAVVSWFGRRHGWNITREMIIYTTSVVPAISATIKALAEPGDKVIIQTPVYNCFFSSIRNNGCEIFESPLIYENGRYSMDFDDLEKKAQDPKAKLLLLCNPHNPAGRVWTREELARVNEICMRHGVMVISDEIHCELVFPGHEYTPFAAVNEECQHNSVTLNSPSKAFNTAGLHIANIISDSEEIRAKIDKAININEVCDVTPFGVVGLMAAYNEGAEWLDALIAYLYENYKTLSKFFRENLPQLPVTDLEGTYLVWVDSRALGDDADKVCHDIFDKEKLWLNPGNMYGDKHFIRINIACPRKQMLEGLECLKHYVDNLS